MIIWFVCQNYICMLRKVTCLCNWYDLSVRQVALAEAPKSLKVAKASTRQQSKFPVLCLDFWNQKMQLVKQRECWQFLTGEALPQFRIWSSRASKERSFRVGTQHMTFDLNCSATLQPHFLFMLFLGANPLCEHTCRYSLSLRFVVLQPAAKIGSKEVLNHMTHVTKSWRFGWTLIFLLFLEADRSLLLPAHSPLPFMTGSCCWREAKGSERDAWVSLNAVLVQCQITTFV